MWPFPSDIASLMNSNKKEKRYERDKKAAKEEDSEEVSLKCLIRLLGQDQCFSSNFIYS